MAEHPAALMRRAAARLLEASAAATPPPWRVSFLDGRVPVVDGPGPGIVADPRRADAELIVILRNAAGPLAGWLEETARRCEENVAEDRPECTHDDFCRCEKPLLFGCDFCGEWLVTKGCTCWDGAMATARAILGEAEGNG
jgi:hypothetical protein